MHVSGGTLVLLHVREGLAGIAAANLVGHADQHVPCGIFVVLHACEMLAGIAAVNVSCHLTSHVGCMPRA